MIFVSIQVCHNFPKMEKAADKTGKETIQQNFFFILET